MAQPVVVVGGDTPAAGGDATAAFAAGAATVVSAAAAEEAATAAAVAAEAAVAASAAADTAFDARAAVEQLRADMEAGFVRMGESFDELLEMVTEEEAADGEGAAPELVDQAPTPESESAKPKKKRTGDAWWGTR